jgi:hypothetical protein
MDKFTFAVQLTSALAWPLVACVLGLVFRSSIQHILTTVKKVKGLGVEFEREVTSLEPSVAELAASQVTTPTAVPDAQLQPTEKAAPVDDAATKRMSAGTLTSVPDKSRTLLEQVSAVADIAPSAAVVLAWTNVEQSIGNLVAHVFPRNLQLHDSVAGAQIIALHNANVINSAVELLLDRMRGLRNKAAHTGTDDQQILSAQARSYAEMAVNIIAYLESLKFTNPPRVA